MRTGARKLPSMGLVLCESVEEDKQVHISPAERLKLRRQMAAAAVKKETRNASACQELQRDVWRATKNKIVRTLSERFGGFQGLNTCSLPWVHRS